MKKIVLPMAALAILLLASCTKDKNLIKDENLKSETLSTQTQYVMASGKVSPFPSLLKGKPKMRQLFEIGSMPCIPISENCHPEDIIIKPHLEEVFRASSKQGAIGIKKLFSNETTALELIPSWNEAWFKDVKSAILSGEYTFISVGVKERPTFLLGKTGKVTSENFDYVLQYVH